MSWVEGDGGGRARSPEAVTKGQGLEEQGEEDRVGVEKKKEEKVKNKAFFFNNGQTLL